MNIYWQIYWVIGAAIAMHRVFGFARYIDKSKTLEKFPVPDEVPVWMIGFVMAVIVLSLAFVMAATWPLVLFIALTKRKK